MTGQEYLGNYELQEPFGSNPFFEWRRAIDIARKRPVIIKIFKLDFASERKRAQLFGERAQFACELVHPHLAWTWEAGEIDGQYFLAERFVEGLSLRQVLNNDSKLTKENAQAIISQIARGLDFMHEKGFFHGNVKPENIIINPDLGAILTDVGPSISLQAITPHWASVIDNETAPYTAPDIWKGSSPSSKSDQYSLACIFAEMLSGEQTFGAASINAIKEKHLAAFQAPLSWAACIPWPTAHAILRALESDASKRFPDLESFSQAPQAIVEEIRANPQLKEEADLQLQAWRAAQQKAQKDAEEAARLEALEKAKQEIEEEQKRREAERKRQLLELSKTTSIENKPESAQTKNRRRISRGATRSWRGAWAVLAGVILIVLAMWQINEYSGGSSQPTSTPTLTVPSVSNTPTIPASPTTEATTTPSPAPTKTATRTKTSTQTKTPTTAGASTITPTASQTITPTRTPRDEDRVLSGSLITRPIIQTLSP